jgi:hypothetical protein
MPNIEYVIKLYSKTKTITLNEQTQIISHIRFLLNNTELSNHEIERTIENRPLCFW